MKDDRNPQRIVVAMIDGFGLDYLAESPMPHLRRMADGGLFRPVSAVFPSITNVNNVSIACGAWPSEHGITGNSYFDPATGRAEYMNAGDMIRRETVFRRAARHGVRSALLTSKRKTVELFGSDATVAVAAEAPPEELVARHGPPGDIYSREINDWLWRVAVDWLRNRPDLGLLYVHTTDYPMHRWAPDEAESKEHLLGLDHRLAEATEAAPDAAFYLTADHGMNAKTHCWDLARVCDEAGLPVRFVLSPERDYYVKHHRNFTGCAWIWLRSSAELDRVERLIGKLDGVEEVIGGEEAARRFHLVPERLGDLVVLGDRDTMFGDMDRPHEILETDYRAHGSLHEMAIPLVVWNARGELPPPSTPETNKDLLRHLYR